MRFGAALTRHLLTCGRRGGMRFCSRLNRRSPRRRRSFSSPPGTRWNPRPEANHCLSGHGCPPCLLSTSDAAHRARDLRGNPARQLRRVLASALRLLCGCDLSPHGRPQTVVNAPCATPLSAITAVRAPTHCCSAGVRRQVTAGIPAAPRAGATSRDPMFGHAPDRLATPPDFCSNTVDTALLGGQEKGPSCSRGPQSRGAHRLPACCNCLR